MNTTIGEKYIIELVQLFEMQGPALYSGQHSLCLTIPCLHYIQRNFTSLEENSPDPVPTQFANLQHLQECLGRILALKLISDKRFPLPPTTTLNLAPFRALQILIMKKVPLQLVTGLQRLRGQLKTLVIHRSQVECLEDVIVRCGGDDSTSFAWSSLRELDLCNNSITEIGDSLQYLPCVEVVNFSNNTIDTNTGGIECVDSLTSLQLGFNHLSTVPKFGSRAKYNLTTLNLRNNSLDDIEGVKELDSLVELDLTDNLLSKHAGLKPLRNLHHLTLLTLAGNPLSFHPRHRLKTVENLSNLINPTMFRLDGKKLTGAEKKAIPRSLTHYSPLNPPLGPIPPRVTRSEARSVPTSDNGSVGRFFSSVPNHSPQDSAAVTGKKRRKKTRTVALSESDEEIKRRLAAKKEVIPSSVPLMNQQKLQQQKDLRKQLQDNWLLSTNSCENTSSTTTDSGSTGATRSASQPPSSKTKPCPSSIDLQQAYGTPHQMVADGGNVREDGGEEGEVFGGDVRESVQASTPTTPGGSVSGECFLVERYESDLEEEGDVEQLLVTLSDTFLEEKNINGKSLDRLDLNCLLAASVDTRPWKGTGWQGDSEQSEVLVLQFNTERRDRRKREYVLTESGDHQSILDLLRPLINQNLATFSIATKVECLRCQHVFESSQAVEQPTDEPQPLSSSRSRSSLSGKKPSLSNHMCPFCNSQLLQYLTPKTFKSPSQFPNLSPPKVTEKTRTSQGDQLAVVVASEENIRAGFTMDNHISGLPVFDSGPSEAMEEDHSFHSFPVESDSMELPKVVVVEARTSSHEYSDYLGESFHDVTEAVDTSWNYDSTEANPDRYNRNSADVLYRYDSQELEASMNSFGNVPRADPKLRLTSSEPASSQRDKFGKIQDNVRDMNTQGGIKGFRRHSSSEDHMGPQRKPKKHSFPNGDNIPQVSTISTTRNYIPGNLGQINEYDSTGFPPEAGSSPMEHLSQSRSSHSSSHSTNPFDDNYSVDPLEQLETEECRPRAREVNDRDSLNQTPVSRRYESRSGFDSYEADFDQLCLNLPEVQVSRSVPSHSELNSYFGKNRIRSDKERALETPESLGHNRSRSADFHPVKANRVTRGSNNSPTQAGETPPSVSSPIRNSSTKSSQASLNSGGSPGGSRGELSRGYSSGEKQGRSSYSHSSNERLARGYSSGEKLAKASIVQQSRGYSSGERLGKGSSDRLSKDYSSGGRSSSDRLVKAYTTGQKPGRGSKAKLARGYGSYSRRQTSTERLTRGYSSGERSTGERRQSSGSDKRASSGSDKGSDQLKRLSGGGGRQERKQSGNLKSSSESGAGRRLHSPSVLVKDDDPGYVHNSLHLHLDMEVFNTDLGEHFKMIFKSPLVQYGQSEEVTSLVVFSNLMAYIYKIIAPESHHPSKWLQMLASHSLDKLVYIDIGVGYQFLRLEFDLPNACYTFLLRDEDRCQNCSTRLAYVVSDAPNSSFKTVGLCSFKLDSIRHPDRVLREVVLTRYEKINGNRHKLLSSVTSDPGGRNVVTYLLAHRHLPGKGQGQLPVTVVVTEDTIFLAQENFQHWPLPRLQVLPNRESLNPPFSNVLQKEISDIEQIVLDRDQNCHVVLRFFKENVTGGESRNWILILQSAGSAQKLVSSIQKPWEVMFETTLPIYYK